MIAINDYIKNDFKPIDSQECVADVQNFFADINYSHFPVVEENIYIGCLVTDDLENFDKDKKIVHYRYALERFYARTSMIWIDLMEVFAKNHTNLLPVLDNNNQYAGYYEIQDIIKVFNDTPFLKEPGGIIIVEKEINDYSMGQIVQIIESNNARILGCFISETTASTVQVTIKIVLGSLNEIIQTFRRYEYEIVSTHQEDTFLSNLKERSEYLDKYLSI